MARRMIKKTPPRLFDPAQVETLLAFGGAEMHPRGVLPTSTVCQRPKSAKHARGSRSERAARLQLRAKLGTSALKTWLEVRYRRQDVRMQPSRRGGACSRRRPSRSASVVAGIIMV